MHYKYPKRLLNLHICTSVKSAVSKMSFHKGEWHKSKRHFQSKPFPRPPALISTDVFKVVRIVLLHVAGLATWTWKFPVIHIQAYFLHISKTQFQEKKKKRNSFPLLGDYVKWAAKYLKTHDAIAPRQLKGHITEDCISFHLEVAEFRWKASQGCNCLMTVSQG